MTHMTGNKRLSIWFLFTTVVSIYNICTIHIFATNWPLYHEMVGNYQQTLNRFVGPTEVFVSGDTLQLKDYSKTDWQWTMFNPQAKQQRHDIVFPEECKKAFSMGADLAK